MERPGSEVPAEGRVRRYGRVGGREVVVANLDRRMLGERHRPAGRPRDRVRPAVASDPRQRHPEHRRLRAEGDPLELRGLQRLAVCWWGGTSRDGLRRHVDQRYPHHARVWTAVVVCRRQADALARGDRVALLGEIAAHRDRPGLVQDRPHVVERIARQSPRRP